MGAAVFNMAMGQGVNAGLNAGNQYVDAAWDVTEKNKGFDGNYQNSFKKVNKDLKKQKLADLAGVNIFSMLETIISAGIRDEMKADDRGFYKELGMSGAEARAQVSLDDSNEALREKKNKEIENVEKRNKNHEKKQAAQREEQRRQEEKAAQLVNANQGMTPDAVKGEQGEAKDGLQDEPVKKTSLREVMRKGLLTMLEKVDPAKRSLLLSMMVANNDDGQVNRIESLLYDSLGKEQQLQLEMLLLDDGNKDSGFINASFTGDASGIKITDQPGGKANKQTIGLENAVFVKSAKENYNERLEEKDMQISKKKERIAKLESDHKRLYKSSIDENKNITSEKEMLIKLEAQREQIVMESSTFNNIERSMRQFGEGGYTLTNVVASEALSKSQMSKIAIAYAYMNKIGNGEVREPIGAEISKYRLHNNKFFERKASDKINFLSQYTECMAASVLRLVDTDSVTHDPTEGATHWFSVESSDKDEMKNPIFRKEHNAWFPRWAISNDTYKNAKNKNQYWKPNYKEYAIYGINQNEFLFYRGVR